MHQRYADQQCHWSTENCHRYYCFAPSDADDCKATSQAQTKAGSRGYLRHWPLVRLELVVAYTDL